MAAQRGIETASDKFDSAACCRVFACSFVHFAHGRQRRNTRDVRYKPRPQPGGRAGNHRRVEPKQHPPSAPTKALNSK